MASEMVLWYPPSIYGFVDPFFGWSVAPEYVAFRPKIFGPYGPYTYGPY